MEKIKILVDGRWFDSYYSGVTTYLKGIYNSIAQDPDFKITVIGRDLTKLEKEFPENIEFIEFKSSSNFKRLYYDLPKIISKNKFDYAHFQYICPVIKRCKYIVTLHDLLFLDYLTSFPLNFILKNSLLFFISAKRADVLLTVSEYSKQRISHHFNIDQRKIFVTPNGILKSYNNEYNLVKSPRTVEIENYILFVSRIEPRKNHIALLRAFVELKLYLKFKLIFVGKKTISVNKLDEYIESLSEDIKSKIIIIENIPEAELKRLYGNTSLFVYPSQSEGFGIPPLEAICCGAKTICSNATALGDFDFFLDYQFDPDNLLELKTKLLSTLNDENYPIAEFQKIIHERYNWESIGEKFKKILINQLNK